MTRPNRTNLRIAFGVTVIGGLLLGGFAGKPLATEPSASENTESSTQTDENSNPVLDKCPVSRENFDSLRMGVPEWAAMDTLLCSKGEVIQEYDVGFGRQSVPLRVWKFPREGGGFIVITTTGHRVSAKRWE